MEEAAACTGTILGCAVGGTLALGAPKGSEEVTCGGGNQRCFLGQLTVLPLVVLLFLDGGLRSA